MLPPVLLIISNCRLAYLWITCNNGWLWLYISRFWTNY